MGKIVKHEDLEVYQRAFETSMCIFNWTKTFPKEELHSLTDQIRRSSRSVSSSIAEAWRKRRYFAVFINKLTDAEAEAAETQSWLEYAYRCGYMSRQETSRLKDEYDGILRTIVGMETYPETWILRKEPPSHPTR